MAELKTKKTEESVEDFLNRITDEKKRQDSFTILELMKKETRGEARMWGPSIIGFGDYRYKYSDGHEIDWFVAGFSPRKQNLTLYLFGGYERYQDLMKKLGKYKNGKSCLYIKKIEDIDLQVLRELVRQSVAHARKK
jgi:hypothetical protein